MPTATRKAAAPLATGAPKDAIDTASQRRYCAQPIHPQPGFDASVSPARVRAILAARRKWVNGTQLTYCCFQRGDPVPAAWQGQAADFAVVDEAFDTWARLGIGINFRRVQAPEEAMVRIGFDPHDGAWSCVGRTLLEIRSPLERTMNFAWPLAAEAGLDTALHAIGHTLGLEHEHQHPHAGIAWNRQAVLDVFGAAPHHWTEAEIEWNVLRRLDAAEARRPHWDPDSVMGFGFDAGLIDAPAAYKSGHCPKGGLSYGDKAWVVEAYPGVRAPPVGSLKVGASQLLKLKAGETRVFDFLPSRTRDHDIATFGRSDALLVLFETTPEGNVQIAGDDDSGTARNAHLRARLHRGRHYQLGVRLFHAEVPFETALMVW